MEIRNIEKYAKDYLEHDFEDKMIYYRRKKVLEFLNFYKPENVLEAGCGSKSIFEFYKSYKTFTIVEPSVKFCEIVKNSNKFNPNISIINDFLENKTENLKHNKYDFIILSSLLHEVNQPENLLKSVRSLCNNNTIVHINVPNSESFHLLWAYKSGLIDNIGNLTGTAKKLQQNTTYNISSLSKFVQDLGFSIVDKGSYFIKPFNHSKMQCLVNEKIVDENLLDGLYNLIEYFPQNGAEIFVNCKVNK